MRRAPRTIHSALLLLAMPWAGPGCGSGASGHAAVFVEVSPYDAGYVDGYDDGADEGYAAGYDEGFAGGYDHGYVDGFERRGYDPGFEACCFEDFFIDLTLHVLLGSDHDDAYVEGYEDGYFDGYHDTFPEGYEDGYLDGYDLGYRDGLR